MTLLKITDEIHWLLEKSSRSQLGYIWRNAAGGWHPFAESDLTKFSIYDLSESREALENYLNARRVLEAILDRTLSNGLIAPSGKYYSCFSGCHSPMVEYAMNREDYLAECREGSWMHIRSDNWCTFSFDHFSDAQKAMLEKIGRSYEDRNYRNFDLKYEDAFPDGNPTIDALFKKFEEIAKAEEKKFQPVILTPAQLSLYL